MPWFARANTGLRLALALALGLVGAGVALALSGLQYAAAAGWDVTGIVLLAWVWFTIWPMGAEATSRYATREDPTRAVSDILLLAAAVASLGAVGVLLLAGATAKGSTADVLAGLVVVTVAVSWFLVHTVFTLRYAMLYYSGADGGVDFNQRLPPRYSDFAYLAFTVGMTFQVSDTDLTKPPVRATALRHALLSYLFGAVILAATVNLLAGLASSG